jgi:hypothetical protein
MSTEPVMSNLNGWVEVLFHRDPKIRFRLVDDLKEADYAMVGSSVPLAELTKLYDVVYMLRDNLFGGMPRAMGHGDALQVVYRGVKTATRTWVIVDAQLAFSTMQPGLEIPMQGVQGERFGLLALPQRFASKRLEALST